MPPQPLSVGEQENAYHRSYIAKLCSEVATIVHDKSGIKSKCHVVKGPTCIKSLKRIRKEINLDQKDEKKDTMLCLGELRFVEQVLIPLAMQYQNDLPLLNEVTKLVVQLTMPQDDHDHLDDDVDLIQKHRQDRARMNHLLNAKCAFLTEGVMASFTALLDGPLLVESSQRTEHDKLVVELVLWLIRNLLCIPDPTANLVGSSKSHLLNLHEDFILMLERECISDVLLHLSECVGLEGNREWNLILLDIFFHIFRGVAVDDLFVSDSSTPQSKISSSNRPLHTGVDELQGLLAKSSSKRAKSLALPSRHSRFGGVFKTAGGSVFNLNQKKASERDAGAIRATTKRAPGRAKKKDESALPSSLVSASKTIRSKKLRTCLREFCDGFLKSCYAHLFKALIADINRQDVRVLPRDSTQFLWLSSFCMQFQRLKLQHADYESTAKVGNLPSQLYNWTESPLFVSMDLWSFQYVIKSCQIHLDEKKWATLEVNVRSLKEMMYIVLSMQRSSVPICVKRSNTLQNSVFYELGELDTVAQMLRGWDPVHHTWNYLVDLCFLTDHLLGIVKGMEMQGAVVQAGRRRARKKDKQKEEGEKWGAEETHALVEGVKEHGSLSKSFRRILKDPSYAAVFDDKQRTFKQLAARWKIVNAALESGTTLTNFLEQEGAVDDSQAVSDKSDDDDDDAAALMKEHQMDFQNFLKRFVANNTVYNMCRAVDPRNPWMKACRNGKKFQLQRAVASFLEAARDSGRSSKTNLEGMMWHVQMFDLYFGILKDHKPQLVHARETLNPGESRSAVEGCNALAQFVRSTVERFFTHAKRNPMAFVEVLFWRTKMENEAMSKNYMEHHVRKSKYVHDDDNHYGGIDGEESNNNRYDDDELGEATANFDNVSFSTRTANGKRVSAGVVAEGGWSESELEFLRNRYPELSATFPGDVFEILSLEEEMYSRGRSPKDIARQCKLMDLSRVTAALRKELLQKQLAAYEELDESKLRKLVIGLMSQPSIANVDAADSVSFLLSVLGSCKDARSRNTIDIASDAVDWRSFPIVPASLGVDLWMRRPAFRKLLLFIGCRPPNRDESSKQPSKKRSERYWRIVKALNPELLGKLIDTLKDTVLDASTLNEMGAVLNDDDDEDSDNEEDGSPAGGKRDTYVASDEETQKSQTGTATGSPKYIHVATASCFPDNLGELSSSEEDELPAAGKSATKPRGKRASANKHPVKSDDQESSDDGISLDGDSSEDDAEQSTKKLDATKRKTTSNSNNETSPNMSKKRKLIVKEGDENEQSDSSDEEETAVVSTTTPATSSQIDRRRKRIAIDSDEDSD